MDTRKSPQPLPFYFAGVRTSGLTEKQLAVRACSLDTSRNSPYKQPVVLPGLPPGNGANIVAPVSPCTIIPPRPSKVGGRRLSRCTILPYEGGTGSLANERRRSTMMYQSIAMSSKPADETRKVRWWFKEQTLERTWDDDRQKGDIKLLGDSCQLLQSHNF